VSDTGQEQNAKSMLQYLYRNGKDLFDDFVIIGSAPNVNRYDGSNDEGGQPLHPTLILGALYVHLYHKWGAGAQLAEPSHRIETLKTGVSLEEITGRNGNLYQMLVQSIRLEKLLRETAEQAPDERMAWFSLYPLSYSLCWASIEWLLKSYAVKANLGYAEAWVEMKTRLIDLANGESKRRRWITDLARDKRLFRFDEHAPERDATTDYHFYRDTLRRDEGYRKLKIRASDHDGVLREITSFIGDWTSSVLLREARNRSGKK
jgi:hypothetical protein